MLELLCSPPLLIGVILVLCFLCILLLFVLLHRTDELRSLQLDYDYWRAEERKAQDKIARLERIAKAAL